MSRAAMGCENCECEAPEERPWRVVLYAPDGSVYEESAIDKDSVDLSKDTDIPTGTPWDDDEQDTPLASFNAAAERTFARARAVHMQRGNEYLDSWALDNVHSPFVRHVLREVFGIHDATPEQLRLLMSAALVDVKDSRMGGAFKLDTIDDGINYRAAFCSWMEDYQANEAEQAEDDADWDEFIKSLDD